MLQSQPGFYAQIPLICMFSMGFSPTKIHKINPTDLVNIFALSGSLSWPVWRKSRYDLVHMLAKCGLIFLPLSKRDLEIVGQRSVFHKMSAQSSQNVGIKELKRTAWFGGFKIREFAPIAFPDDDFTELSVMVRWDSASPLWLHSDLHPTPEWPPEDTQQFGEALSVISLITTPETRQQVHPLSLAAAALFPLHRYAASYSVPPLPFPPSRPSKFQFFRLVCGRKNLTN